MLLIEYDGYLEWFRNEYVLINFHYVGVEIKICMEIMMMTIVLSYLAKVLSCDRCSKQIFLETKFFLKFWYSRICVNL
jgi:hypothetical protein